MGAESKLSDLLADLREAVPRVTIARVKMLLLFIAVFFLGLSLFVALSHVIPPVDFQR